MGSLSGIRFFAILHIFLFHLWSTYKADQPEQYRLILIDFVRTPETLGTFFSNGWMSTSFFFLLSGFMLAYIYWGKDGELSTSTRKFLFFRLTRIYPVHILVLCIVFVMGLSGLMYMQNFSRFQLIASGVSTLALVQAWFPNLVPVWSWPSWNLSALLFLYLLTPSLMHYLGKLSHKQMSILLGALPFISLIPSAIYSLAKLQFGPLNINYYIFLAHCPLFWVPHFIAGMLLTRVFHLNRFSPPPEKRGCWVSLGDFCLIAMILVACTEIGGHPIRIYLRHGILMPLYLIIILDLARGRGLISRLFSLPGMAFLGETGFSIFVWQVVVMGLCFVMLSINPAFALHQLWVAISGVIIIAIVSTHFFEKPLQVYLRKKFRRFYS